MELFSDDFKEDDHIVKDNKKVDDVFDSHNYAKSANEIDEHSDIPFDTMIEGMSNDDYHSFGGLSSTKFPLMDLSIRAFENRHLFDFDKPVFDLGNLCHDCILLPELVADGYIESPTIGLDTLQAKKMRDDNPDKMVVGQGDIEKYETIAKLVRLIVHFISFPQTKKEVSFFHKHKETGLTFQIRPDVYNPDIGIMYDVKSTKANTHREFSKIIEEYNYDLSLAFYCDVLKMCGYNIDTNHVGWICVPKIKPNIPFVYRCSPELLEKGRSKYQRLLAKYVEYKKEEQKVGKDNATLIYSDIAEKVAYSWEYRKQNFI